MGGPASFAGGNASEDRAGLGSVKSRTPALQRKLYLKAKAEPDFRFHPLYDKIHREDIQLHAYRPARSQKGPSAADY